MKKLTLFFILSTFSTLSATAAKFEHPIESISKDVKVKTSGNSLIYDVSSKSNAFYYASCKFENNKKREYCEVTEDIPVTNGASYTRTCLVKYDTLPKPNQKDVKVLKSWKDAKVLLMDFKDSTLWIQIINMTSCDFTTAIVFNIESFQVYITNDNEFDVLYSKDDADFIKRDTYTSDDQQIRDSQLHAVSPNLKWEVLYLGNASYHHELRQLNDSLVEVVTKIHPDHYNKTDLMMADGINEIFISSNSQNEFGVCKVSKDKGINCHRYDQFANTKLNFTLRYNDFLRGRESPYKLFLHNLGNGNLMIVIVYYDVVTDVPESFSPIIVRPDGHYDHPLEIEFVRSEFWRPSKVVKKSLMPPAVKVIEKDDEFCFQFIWTAEQDAYSTLRYRTKCASKNVLGYRNVETKGSTSGSGVASQRSYYLVLASVLLLFCNFVN